MITFMRALVGICVCFSLAVEAAPAAVRQRFVVTAQVLAVDCTARPVKIRACAPVAVNTETLQSGHVKTSVTRVLYY